MDSKKENWKFLYWDDPIIEKKDKSKTKTNDKNSSSTNRKKSTNQK